MHSRSARHVLKTGKSTCKSQLPFDAPNLTPRSGSDPEALYSLAWVYEHGELGVERDHHKALDLLYEAMEHAYLEELLPLAVAVTYFQLHECYLCTAGFLEQSKRGLVGASEVVIEQGDTILVLLLSTILFWVVARLRRRLNQVDNSVPLVRRIDVRGRDSEPESVEVVQPSQVLSQAAAHMGNATPLVGQAPNESRDGESAPNGCAHGNAGRSGDLRHRSASNRAQG